MVQQIVLQQFAAAHKLSLATEHDVKMATAKYLNFYCLNN